MLSFAIGSFVVQGISSLRKQNRAAECKENLTKLRGRREQWALENAKPEGTPVTLDELEDDALKNSRNGYFKPVPRECPSGKGIYILNAVGTDPVCTSGLPGHSLSEVGAPITAPESQN